VKVREGELDPNVALDAGEATLPELEPDDCAVAEDPESDIVERSLTIWAAATLTRVRPKKIDFMINESGLRGAVM
jgi:hypothetical protein